MFENPVTLHKDTYNNYIVSINLGSDKTDVEHKLSVITDTLDSATPENSLSYFLDGIVIELSARYIELANV